MYHLNDADKYPHDTGDKNDLLSLTPKTKSDIKSRKIFTPKILNSWKQEPVKLDNFLIRLKLDN